jgi:predicted transcriptional regulator of viral defense system
MKFHELLVLVRNQPLFETGLLLAGDVDSDDIRRQLSRWVRIGKIRQLRRGLYMLAPPYQSVVPHPFLVANALVPGSYVSGQSALAHYGLIPEYTPHTTSVTTAHTSQWDGGFIFHHLVPHLFFGYQKLEVSRGQEAFVALPEKSLLDLAHLTPNADSPEYITQLRLQNLEQLNLKRLNDLAARADKPKWNRVANQVAAWVAQEENQFEELP